MRNPTRRNRNIGTSKQGHGQNNKLTIPEPNSTLKSFYERLGKYEKLQKTINGHDFLFIVEHTRANSKHCCSIGDIERIIGHIPPHDYGKLKLIVLRQPKRKEEILAPTWGRLIYSYKFEGEYHPAIIIDAIDLSKKLKWSKQLSVDDQNELNRLKEDGHEIINNGRYFMAQHTYENVRNTQLYRTLPHEFGHYVHYLELVERAGKEDEQYELWEARDNKYCGLTKSEKEIFAHKYADALRIELTNKNVIPFDPK